VGLDIRTPIGLMFAILGVLLVVYGFISDAAIYERSLGMNVNIGWGVVLLVFGIVMTALGKFGGKNTPPAAGEAPATGGRAGH
jgi:hypothetical protein